MGKEEKRTYPIKDYLGTVEDKLPDEGTFVVAVSTETPDRDNEVLRASGFELSNYRKNPVVLWAHDYSAPPIGKALWVKTVGDKLKAKVKFASTQFAQEIKQLYEEGFLSAWSVGFIPKKWVDGEEGSEISREYTKQEMLEFSAVPVPANPDALLEAVKMVKDVELKKMLKKQIKEQGKEKKEDIGISVEGESGKHSEHEIKIIKNEKQGIDITYCETCRKIIGYIFNVDNDWEKEKAEEWIKEHSKNVAEIIANDVRETMDNMTNDDWKSIEENIDKYLETGEIKTTYKCSCIDCGWETETDKHCKDIKCEKCGGTMRRSDRPGPGEESGDGDKGEKEGDIDESKNLVKISDSLLEFEEGKIDRKEILARIEKAMTDVMEKVGAVLSKNNKAKLVIAKENIQSILDVAEINTSDDDKAISLDDILEAIKAIGEKKKEVKKEEVKPPKVEVKSKKEVSDAEVQDIKAIIHEQAGECLDKWVGEIRTSILGKV